MTENKASGSKGLFYNDLTERRTLHTEAPSGRELAPQATEGECVTTKQTKTQRHAGSFRHASRATFLPEEGLYSIPASAHLLTTIVVVQFK